MLAERRQQRFLINTFPVQVLLNDLSMQHQQGRGAFHPAPQARPAQAQAGHRGVHQQQDQRRQDPAQQAGIRTNHRILDGIGDLQQHHQVEDGHLALQLALARKPQAEQNHNIYR